VSIAATVKRRPHLHRGSLTAANAAMSGAAAVASDGKWCVDGIVRSFDQAFRVSNEILPKRRTFIIAAHPENAKALHHQVRGVIGKRALYDNSGL